MAVGYAGKRDAQVLAGEALLCKDGVQGGIARSDPGVIYLDLVRDVL